jgi:hypothetical protein
MYCKVKGSGSFLVYKANILLVYFIKQNTTWFCRVFFLVLNDIWLITSSILKNDSCFLNPVIHDHYLISCDGLSLIKMNKMF